MFFYRFLSLTNLFNNVPIKTVLEANVKCHAAVRWNVITSILAAPTTFSRENHVSTYARRSSFARHAFVRFQAQACLFSNFSFTPFFILVYSLTSANLLRAWNDVRFIIVTDNESLVGYGKILHAKEVA